MAENGTYPPPPPVVVVPPVPGGGGGNIGTDSAAVLALLADTSRAGRGGGGFYGGYGGEGGYGGHGAGFTTPSSLQHGVDNLGRQGFDQSHDLREMFLNQNLVGAVGSIGGAVASSEQRVMDRLNSHEINELRETSDLARQLAACCCENQKGLLEAQLRAQECCCETQKLIQADGQKTRDLINDGALRSAIDTNNISATVGAINAAAAQNTAAIVAAIGAIGHHGGH